MRTHAQYQCSAGVVHDQQLYSYNEQTCNNVVIDHLDSISVCTLIPFLKR